MKFESKYRTFINEMPLKMSSAKWRPFCPGGAELIYLTLCNVSSRDIDTFSKCLRHLSIWPPCSGIAWVDIPEFAPLWKSWIHVMSFLDELERSAPVSMGSPLNHACETRLGPFSTGLERQLDEFPVSRTLGLALHSFSAIGCFIGS